VNRTEKQEAVDALVKDFAAHSVVFALDYRGLKVEEATDLRRKIRDTGGKYRVVKNTLTLRALEGTPYETISGHFKGMTGLAYTDSDPVALAKVLNDFAKDVPALEYKAGVMSGKELDEEQFKVLATLPGRDKIYAQLLSVLQAPMRNLLSVFQASARDLILVLKAAVDKKKED
jgi:large subunit ribosomal protein L10